MSGMMLTNGVVAAEGKRGRQGKTKMAASQLALGILLLVSSSMMMVVCQEEEFSDNCLYESKDACTKADARGCVWCDLPRRCFSAARSLELGKFCNRKKLKTFVDVTTCEEVADQHHCHRGDSCVWCRSEAVDDGCFSEIEAVRLPKHIFSCPPASTTTVTGIGL